jgi:hypothetical protein
LISKNNLRRMYWNTKPISYWRRGMDLETALKAAKSKGDSCVFCAKSIASGAPVVVGEYRVGGKIIGKTVRVESCIECVKAARDLIDLRIKEATSL